MTGARLIKALASGHNGRLIVRNYFRPELLDVGPCNTIDLTEYYVERR